ncbi:hypothetical protein [Streptomyces sp. NPDC001970]
MSELIVIGYDDAAAEKPMTEMQRRGGTILKTSLAAKEEQERAEQPAGSE